MAGSDATTLSLSTRSTFGSRANRRLRRDGRVPGVIYGGEGDPIPFEVDARILRNTLAHAHTLLEVSVDGGKGVPVILKDAQRHPVRGEIMHTDFLRVDMKVAIQTTVVLELTGTEEAPGVTEGGVLSQEMRELTVEALPGDLPDTLTHDVSGMQINETLTLGSIQVPDGVTLVDDPETVVATITPPTLEPTEDEIEMETEVVGEDGEVEEGKAEGDTGDEAAEAASDDATE